ncbi:MAG TPA: HWE histidine kinase domain-containing protein [Reyranella sp.]|jgi:PAS domain S-box-containing protein|nr:HWE histidine kinase domain-containing protein [Reyranella sp.]
MDKVNILLIDDQPAKLLSYEVILAELGENLIKATSPHEALGILLKTEDVAVVLIDVVMPQLDGFQLAAMIREHPRFQKLAIIFVSAIQVGEMDHLRGYEIGAVDYVSVPVVPKVLRAKVRVFVDLYRKTRQLEVLNSELEARVAARTAELEAQTERLRQSEERRSIALSAGDMGSWEVDLVTGHLEWDDGPYRIFGVDPADFEPTVERIEAMMHPDDREKHALAAIVGAGGSRFQVEFRIVRPNGEVRWCYGAGIITRDADGKPVRMNGVTVDITDRKRAEERQVLLAREVDHRAKNTLAVVLSVLRLTRAPTTKDFIATVEGRVHALAATHNLLSATRWEGADLGKIVEEEMAPYQANHRQRVITDGPAVVLLPATAQAVALALHELATNAAKYGALSTETGTLAVTWRAEGDALVLDWTETGGPPTAEPARLGFGLTIVRSSIEAQFRGGVSYEWRREGLRCTLSIPAAQIAAPPAAAEAPVAAPADNGTRRSLADMRLLVVEDELLVSMLIQEILGELGATVAGPYARLSDGLAAAKAEGFDGAILDLNLAGESADPLADFLLARGVPFVFITGYQRESIDRRYANVPVLQKPIDAAALEGVLLTLLGSEPLLRVADGG